MFPQRLALTISNKHSLSSHVQGSLLNPVRTSYSMGLSKLLPHFCPVPVLFELQLPGAHQLNSPMFKL